MITLLSRPSLSPVLIICSCPVFAVHMVSYISSEEGGTMMHGGVFLFIVKGTLFKASQKYCIGWWL